MRPLQLSSKQEIVTVLRSAAVAVFPNRAEGGTNLVAMETMAVGVPVIISNNTGHKDIIREKHCYPLRRQSYPHAEGEERERGWGESSVDEIVELLEDVYQNREEASRRGKLGSKFIRERFTWELAIRHLAAEISTAAG
jgi:glycosyltransferase involved in cell wall biosynthesis